MGEKKDKKQPIHTYEEVVKKAEEEEAKRVEAEKPVEAKPKSEKSESKPDDPFVEEDGQLGIKGIPSPSVAEEPSPGETKKIVKKLKGEKASIPEGPSPKKKKKKKKAKPSKPVGEPGVKKADKVEAKHLEELLKQARGFLQPALLSFHLVTSAFILNIFGRKGETMSVSKAEELSRLAIYLFEMWLQDNADKVSKYAIPIGAYLGTLASVITQKDFVKVGDLAQYVEPQPTAPPGFVGPGPPPSTS